MSNLSDRLQMALRRLRGKTQLTETDIEQMMREVRLSLLEADVNFLVVKQFTKEVKEKALGQDILKGLNPGEQVVKIVDEELTKLMGSENVGINFDKNFTTIMVCGLQGSGKTTSIAKLSVYLRKVLKKKPFIIAADIYRPAAIKQLVTLGKQIDIPVFEQGQINPLEIVKNGLQKAKDEGFDTVIIDTAGRLHIDNEMMEELVNIQKNFTIHETLLTVDSMTGQDAANIAKSFCEQLKIDGVILTKLDGDTRGGAALSVKYISGVDIKFMSSGEKMDTFEVFYPERLSQRILGMGDVLSLIEKVEQEVDQDEAKSMMEKLKNDTFNYNDLLKQVKMMKRMGSISKLLGFLPGMKKLKEVAGEIDEKQFYKQVSIVNSMTPAERKDPKLIDFSSSRRQRIANGAGVSVADVKRLQEALRLQKQTMKKMLNMDPDQMQQAASNPNSIFNDLANQPRHKGKGKNKGNRLF